MRAFRFLNALALVWCFCVVVFGAYVRLNDAGLGCPDWPGCYGHIGVPEAAHEVAIAQQRYPQRPVEAPKAWKEMIHRYLASTLGTLIVGLALLSVALRGAPPQARFAWWLVPLVVFQGILGMWTVTWQLKPLAVTGHLLGGMATLCGLLWLWLSTRPVPEASADPRSGREFRSEREAAFGLAADSAAARADAAAWAVPRGVRGLALAALIAVGVQVFLGGWTSTNYAALACPDFPTCQGRFLPDTDLREAYTLWRGLGINYEHGVLDNRARVTIHFVHRLGAVVVTLLLVTLGAWLLRQPVARWQIYGRVVVAALVLQVGLGVSIVLLHLPLLLAAAHNAGAAILLLTLVSLNHSAWRGAQVPR